VIDRLYFAADALMTELHVSGDKVWGRSEKYLDLGEMQIRTEIEVWSNVLGKKSGSFLAQVSQNLWMYLVVGDPATLYIIDGGKAGLNEINAPSYGGTTIIDTLKQLAERGAITTVFVYEEQVGWSKGKLKEELPV
jgi:hypothetical protein